jgi:hypothetical protein
MTDDRETSLIPFEIVPECEGCAKIVGNMCKTYENPSIFWRNKGTTFYGCACATHWSAPILSNSDKVRIGQQKQKGKTKVAK